MMHRRDFLKVAGSIAALANVSTSGAAATSLAVSENRQASMRVEGHKITLQTNTQSAFIETVFMTSLKRKKTG